MLVLWLLHSGLTREQAAKAVGVGRATVQRYVAAFRAGRLGRPAAMESPSPDERDGRLSRLDPRVLREATGTTMAEACERIFQLTGLRRGPSQVRKFLKDLGLKFQRVRAIPVPPKKTWPSTSKPKPLFSTPN